MRSDPPLAGRCAALSCSAEAVLVRAAAARGVNSYVTFYVSLLVKRELHDYIVFVMNGKLAFLFKLNLQHV